MLGVRGRGAAIQRPAIPERAAHDAAPGSAWARDTGPPRGPDLAAAGGWSPPPGRWRTSARPVMRAVGPRTTAAPVPRQGHLNIDISRTCRRHAANMACGAASRISFDMAPIGPRIAPFDVNHMSGGDHEKAANSDDHSTTGFVVDGDGRWSCRQGGVAHGVYGSHRVPDNGNRGRRKDRAEGS